MKIKVLLVDDHVNVRRGLRKMLDRSSAVEVVGEAGGGIEALKLTKDLSPDIMLLDVEMPDMKGYEVARQLADEGSRTRVLAVSSYEERRYILGMFTSGAVGYVTKDEASEYLLEAVNDIAAGRKGWISPQVAKRLGVPERSVGRNTIPALNHLEKQILIELSEGKTEREIIQSIDAAPTAVKAAVRTLNQKLGAKTPLEVVLRALQEDLV